MSVITERDVAACSLLAKLNGMNTSNTTTYTETDTEVEIEFEDEPAKKPKRATAKKKVEKTPVAPRMDRVPDLDKFKGLKRDVTIKVNQVSHDIKYKEQLWGIPNRELTYNLEVISNPKIARDTAAMFGDKSPEALKAAESGEVRYIRVICYDNNIPYRSREIAYMKVFLDEKERLRATMVLKSTQMKENHINPEKVKKQLSQAKERLLRSGE